MVLEEERREQAAPSPCRPVQARRPRPAQGMGGGRVAAGRPRVGHGGGRRAHQCHGLPERRPGTDPGGADAGGRSPGPVDPRRSRDGCRLLRPSGSTMAAVRPPWCRPGSAEWPRWLWSPRISWRFSSEVEARSEKPKRASHWGPAGGAERRWAMSEPAPCRGGRELRIDRAVYLVDDAARTYRYLRRNPAWKDLDPEENEGNKRHLDGYTRIFPDGRTKVYSYQAQSTTRAHRPINSPRTTRAQPGAMTAPAAQHRVARQPPGTAGSQPQAGPSWPEPPARLAARRRRPGQRSSRTGATRPLAR